MTTRPPAPKRATTRLAITVIALLATLPTTPSRADSLDNRARRDEVVLMRDQEPAMRRAFGRALATLDGFLKLASSPPAGLTGFAVKVGIHEGDNTEYFWLTDFSRHNGGFIGTISNTPRLVRNVRVGQRYRFTRSQIVDWMYIDQPKRKLVGNFTLCALLTKEPPGEAETIRKRFNLDCNF